MHEAREADAKRMKDRQRQRDVGERAVTAAFGTAPPIAQDLRQSPTSDARQFVRIVKR
jgi:hypothetical protein